MHPNFNSMVFNSKKAGNKLAFFLLVAFAASGCTQQIPPDALQLTEESLSLRQLQTRRFDTNDEASLLSAGTALLQDLGFTLEASESKLGVIVAAKQQSAYNAGEVALSVGVALLTLLGGSPHVMPVDKEQKVRASFVTRPSSEKSGSVVGRVTFQRVVWNTQGQVTKSELLKDAEIYQAFFEKLSKAVFLEAHEF